VVAEPFVNDVVGYYSKQSRKLHPLVVEGKNAVDVVGAWITKLDIEMFHSES